MQAFAALLIKKYFTNAYLLQLCFEYEIQRNTKFVFNEEKGHLFYIAKVAGGFYHAQILIENEFDDGELFQKFHEHAGHPGVNSGLANIRKQ